MFKYVAIACLVFYWVSTEIAGAALDPLDEEEAHSIQRMREAELTDAEIEKLLIVRRKYPRSRYSKRASHVSIVILQVRTRE